MPYTTITKILQGYNVPKSVLDAMIDNDAFFFNALGGSGTSSVTSVMNGSFENDSDGDGISDEWEETLFSGGSSAIDDTASAHGTRSLKFTSIGNGGGYWTSKNYLPCSEYHYISVSFYLKSSVAGVKNIVRILWYKSDKSACATPSTDIYSSTSNPTAWTWYPCNVAPPSTARFFKIRLIGCDSSNATAGDTWFDNVYSLEEFQDIFTGHAEGDMTTNTQYGTGLSIAGTTIANAIRISSDGGYEGLAASKDGLSGTIAVTITGCNRSLSLALPPGVWTVIGIANWRNSDSSLDIYGKYRISATAIRQS